MLWWGGVVVGWCYGVIMCCGGVRCVWCGWVRFGGAVSRVGWFGVV